VTRRASILLALAVAVATAACGGEPPPTRTVQLPVGPAGYPAPDQVVENGQHVITEQGVRKAVLVAEQLYFYEQLGKVYGDTIEVTFYDQNGNYESTLTGRSGELQEATQDLLVKGNVFVRSVDSSIRTEELRYDPAQNLVTTTQATEIVQRGNVIRGQGVTADPGLKNIRIRGGSAILREEPEFGPTPSAPDTTAVPQAAPPPGTGGAP
jgi:LPS export ABC transporter protein LptC